jgi:hypothetical protein
LREVDGNPSDGPILKGVLGGKLLNLDMLAREVILPAVRNPANYEPNAKRLT